MKFQRCERSSQHARQQGAITLTMTLLVLIAMTTLTLAGAKIVVNKQRISSNSAHAEWAFYTAEAGIDNAIAYLKANHDQIASTALNGWRHAASNPRWQACNAALTSLPCGNGSSNLYGNSWQYYGPVPNLSAPAGGYAHSVWALSDNLITGPPTTVPLGCLNIGLTALLPTATGVLVGIVNSLLNTLGTLVGQPGMSLPANLCLPLNFSGSNTPPPPSRANPGVRLVSEALHPNDALAGYAVAQQSLSTASLFMWAPMAPLIVDGTVDLTGDIRIFGNTRPPTRAPYDWSVLNLNDVMGLDVSGMVDYKMQTGHAASLAPLLNLTVADVLALDWNATFPLSIWSHQNTTLHSAPTGAGLLSGARSCSPAYDGTTNPACLTLSQTVSIPAGSIAFLVPLTNTKISLYLPDIQDEHNLTSVLTDLLDTSGAVDFPSDLMAHIFGIPSADAAKLQADAIQLANCSSLNSASSGLYWINGNCSLSGTIGTSDAPPIIIVNGHLNLADGARVSGVAYLRGGSTRNITAPASPVVRPTVLGSIVSEKKIIGTGNFNLVHDPDRIRAAGYRAGELTRLPGGWSDGLTGP